MYLAKAFFDLSPVSRITATFIDGKEVEYTASIVHLLLSDPTVENFYDSETGEVLFHR